jgi:hypothetical protein
MKFQPNIQGLVWGWRVMFLSADDRVMNACTAGVVWLKRMQDFAGALRPDEM